MLPNMLHNEIAGQINGDDNVVYISLPGLVKPTNEDRLEYWTQDHGMSACIADGHWGDEAAQHAVSFWKDAGIPDSKEMAIQKTSELERELYTSFGKPVMDQEIDLTPETAFVGINISEDRLDIASYGDCRLLVVNGAAIKYSLEQKSTWLGAFSHLGLRSRMAVKDGLVYERLPLDKEDYVIMFTDGLDECIYERPTISHEEIAESFRLVQPKKILEDLVSLAFSYGAEDNISALIYKPTFGSN